MTADTIRMIVEMVILVCGLIGIWARLEITSARHDERLKHIEKDVENIWNHINPVQHGHQGD